MKRFVSVRFEGVLDPSERDAATRSYISAGATVTSWITTGSRSYATFRLDGSWELPTLAVLRVTPDAARRLPALRAALGGAGAPAGIGAVYRDAAGLVIEFDPRRSPLALVVATIDAELASAPGRTIEPLVRLDDETVAAFAGSLLGEPALDASRFIETHLEPLLVFATAGT